MEPAQIVSCVFYLALAVGSFVISWFQFQEKGFLLNNYYFWATQEERRRMSKEDKRPYYRQSGAAFLLIGVVLLTITVFQVTEWTWMLWVLGLEAIGAVIYAFASSIKLEQRKSEETKC